MAVGVAVEVAVAVAVGVGVPLPVGVAVGVAVGVGVKPPGMLRVKVWHLLIPPPPASGLLSGAVGATASFLS